MAAGAALSCACVTVASSGVDLMLLQLTLFLLGVGCNVLYACGMTLLASA